MAIYYATFEDVAVSAAQDIFELVSPAGTKVAVREILFAQHSDFGDAQAELLSVKLIRGHTTAGSAGSTPSIHTRTGLSAATAASSTVLANNTTIASGGSPQTLVSEAMNVAAGYVHRPLPEERIVLQPEVRFVVRIEAPADELTCNGTIMFEELGIDPHKPV